MTEIMHDLLWYLETTRSDGTVQSGTGFRVRLKAPNDSNFRNYILTCLHVICELDELHCLASSERLPVTCWPESGIYDKRYGILASVVSPLTPIERIGRQLTLDNDWVLLSLDVNRAAEFQKNNRPVRLRTTAVEKGDKYFVYGYPDGSAKFETIRSISGEIRVRATRSAEMTLYHRTSAGFHLEGTATKPGMSGGDVFDSAGNVTGLLRAGHDGQVDREVVSIGWIVNALTELQCEFPSMRNIVEESTDGGRFNVNEVQQFLLSTPKGQLRSAVKSLLSSVDLSGMLTKDDIVCDELGRLDPSVGDRSHLIELGISLLSECGSEKMPLRPGDVNKESSAIAFSRDLYRIAGRIGAPAEAALCAATFITYPTAIEAGAIRAMRPEMLEITGFVKDIGW